MPKASGKTANQKDLIEFIAHEMKCSKAAAKTSLDTVLKGIVLLAEEVDHLSLRDFGKFEMRHRKTRISTTSIDGVARVIPNREALCFTAAPGLVCEVDY